MILRSNFWRHDRLKRSYGGYSQCDDRAHFQVRWAAVSQRTKRIQTISVDWC